MENLAIRDGWGFQKNLVTNPRKKPDAIIPSSLTPRIHAPAPTAKLLHGLRASKSGYCSPTTRDVLANGSLLQPTLRNIGGREQLHRPLHQCGQSVDVELFLKLHADVHHRLVTDT